MTGEIELIAKIKPKNNAFTGIVDASHVLGGDSNKLPDNAVAQSNVTQHADGIYFKIANHTKLTHDNLDIDADTLDGLHASDIVAGGVVPTGTGFRHVTSNIEDYVVKLIENVDIANTAAIVESKLDLNYPTHSANTIGTKTVDETNIALNKVLKYDGTKWIADSVGANQIIGGTGNKLPDNTIAESSITQYGDLIHNSGSPQITYDNSNRMITVKFSSSITRIDYDSDSRALYLGTADNPNAIPSDIVWSIKKIIYDTNGNFIDVQWADGNYNKDNIWNNRISLTYSDI